MSNLSYIVSGEGRIAAVANGQPITVDTDHPNYKAIKECLKSKDADKFISLADIPKSIETYSKGKVTVKDGTIYYGDRVLETSLTKRILWMLDEGFDVQPFILFLENLMLNPSRRAVQELFSWMEHQDIPITEDGCWIGYKYLQSTNEKTPDGKPIYLDVHSRTIKQWLGHVVTMERNDVDEDWGVACSQGLHVGSSRYSFNGDVRVLVKVNPKDVVSVPRNEGEKCRVCAYEIVKIFESVYNSPVVQANGEKIKKYGEEETDEEECEFCGSIYCEGECLDESDEEYEDE